MPVFFVLDSLEGMCHPYINVLFCLWFFVKTKIKFTCGFEHIFLHINHHIIIYHKIIPEHSSGQCNLHGNPLLSRIVSQEKQKCVAENRVLMLRIFRKTI